MKFKTNRSETHIKDNKIGIYNTLVGGVVVTDIDKFEKNLEEMIFESETEYSDWGGKQGFMKYLENLLKNEDKYFKKNPRKITLANQRYQDFCDDMVLYEMIRFAVTGDPVQIAPLEKVEKISVILDEGGLMRLTTRSNLIN